MSTPSLSLQPTPHAPAQDLPAAVVLARAGLEALNARAGQPLAATVLGTDANGLTQLKLGDLTIAVRLSQPLPAGTQVQVTVQPSPTGTPALVVQPQAAPTPQMPAPSMPVVTATPLPLPAMTSSPATATVTSAIPASGPPAAAGPAVPTPTVGGPVLAAANPASSATPAIGAALPVPGAAPPVVAAGGSVATPQQAIAGAPPTSPLAVSPAASPASTAIASGPSAPAAGTAPPGPAPGPVAASPALPATSMPAPTTVPVMAVSGAVAALPQAPAAPSVIPPAVAPAMAGPVPPAVLPQATTGAAPVIPAASVRAPTPAAIAAGPTPTATLTKPAVTTPLPPAPTAIPNAAQPAASPTTLASAPATVATAAPAAGSGASSAAPAPRPSAPLALSLAQPAQAAARQDSLAPLLQNLGALQGKLSTFPQPVVEAAMRLLATRIPADRAPTAQLLKAAIESSGVLQSAARPAGQPMDTKTALLQLRAGLMSMLGNGEVAPVAAIVRRPPPPMRDAQPRAVRAEAPTLPDAATTRDAGRTLLNQTDAALSRLKLTQLASQPDAARAAAAAPDLVVELPMMLGHELSLAQLRVGRDGRQKDKAGERGWRVRFAVSFSVIGEVGAQVSLLGKSASVAIWAEEPATADALEAMLPELGEALAARGLEVGAVRLRRGVPREEDVPAAGRLMDRVR